MQVLHQHRPEKQGLRQPGAWRPPRLTPYGTEKIFARPCGFSHFFSA